MPEVEWVRDDHPAWSDPMTGAFDVWVDQITGEMMLRASNEEGKPIWLYPAHDGTLRYFGSLLLDVADQIELAKRAQRDARRN